MPYSYEVRITLRVTFRAEDEDERDSILAGLEETYAEVHSSDADDPEVDSVEVIDVQEA